LGIYFLVVFIGGALLAPWLWRAVNAVAPGSGLAGSPFHRYVNRSLYFFALVGLWPLLRSLNLRRWSEIGFAWRPNSAQQLGQGLGLGFSSLLGAALVVTLGHGRAWDFDHSAREWWSNVFNATLAALAAGTLEELLFRGALFAPLRRQWGFATATTLTALIYALTHFFKRVQFQGTIEWTSGLAVLGQMCGGFLDWHELVPAFFNLTIAGWALALARERTGTLWFSIGLHAGWIFWVKSFAFLTRGEPLADVWIWGTQKLIDGWLATLVLLAVVPLVGWLTSDSRVRQK
jgi:membrane protease YdiL (CAAX protease family)